MIPNSRLSKAKIKTSTLLQSLHGLNGSMGFCIMNKHYHALCGVNRTKHMGNVSGILGIVGNPNNIQNHQDIPCRSLFQHFSDVQGTLSLNSRKYSTEEDWHDIFNREKTVRVIKQYKEGVPKRRDDKEEKDKFRVPDVLGQFTRDKTGRSKPRIEENILRETRNSQSTKKLESRDKASKFQEGSQVGIQERAYRRVIDTEHLNETTFKKSAISRAQLGRERRARTSRMSQELNYENSFRKEESHLLSNMKSSAIIGNKERAQLQYIKDRIQDVKFLTSPHVRAKNSFESRAEGQRTVIDEAALYIFRGSLRKLRKLFPEKLNSEHLLLLLQCAIYGKKNEVAEKIFNRWISLQHNSEAITAMAANIWGKNGESEKIEKWIKWIDSHAKVESHRVLIRNSLLNSLVRNGEIAKATSIFEELFSLNLLDKSKPHPTAISVSTLMKGYVSIGDIEKVEELYNISNLLGIVSKKDVYVCNLFLEAAVVKNDEELLWKCFNRFFRCTFLKEMEPNTLLPNIVTVNHILKFYAQRGDAKLMEKYLDLFQREDSKRRLNSRTVYILLQCYYQTQQFQKAEEIFKIYFNYGIRKHSGIFETNREICHIMLEVFDKTDQLEAMQQLFDRMYLGRTEATIDESTVAIVIDAYKKRASHLALAAENLKRMERLLGKLNENKMTSSDVKEQVTTSDELNGIDHLEEEMNEVEETQFVDEEIDQDIEKELQEQIKDSGAEKESIKYLW